MKLIESSVHIIEEKDPCKMIELAGRTCYKSEDNITENSAKEFVDRMIKLGHGAMLEHGTVYLEIENYEDIDEIKYKSNPYSRAVAVFPNLLYVTTNLRVIIEHGWEKDLKWQCEPTKYHDKRITVKFICDRGVSHEFVRHRTFSFAQESTRYCNYSKDKFGNELTFILPSTWIDTDIETKVSFMDFLESCESQYLKLIDKGWKPQQARQVLPNALKTELVMTGFESDWDHFFELRRAGAAHPDAKKLADELYEMLNKHK